MLIQHWQCIQWTCYRTHKTAFSPTPTNFKKVVRQHMVTSMEEHSLLNPSQHIVCRGRSCLSQLIDHSDNITAAMERGLGIDVSYLDFAKAFDKVDLGIILRKLKSLSIKGQPGQWFMAFLLDHVQSVLKKQKAHSSTCHLRCSSGLCTGPSPLHCPDWKHPQKHSPLIPV